MKIVFATNNQHKLEEIRSILGESIEVLSLKDIGCDADIPETGTTLEENALQKAQYIYDHYHISVFADDTGLEVDALDGAPGVYSARYASMAGNSSEASPASHDSEANMARLLKELGNNNNRKARFRTVIALILKKDICPCGCTSIKEIHRFEGIVEGEIIRERRGGEGFGYDPVFQPDGYDKTFAELGMDIKNQISHRARAVKKLADFLLFSPPKLGGDRGGLSKLIITCLLLLTTFIASAQVGTWKNHLAYHDVQNICKANNNLFVLASNDLYQYNLNDQSITTYDKVSGLSDTHITHIAWNQKAKRLIAVYENSNIDLIDTDGNIINIAALYNKAMTEDKTVTAISVDDVYAYLTTSFAILKVNMQKAEISETYTNNNPEYPSNLTPYQDDYEAYISTVSTLNPGGPSYNRFCESKFINGSLYTTGGYFLPAMPDNETPGTIQVFDGNNWTLYQEQINEITGYQYVDIDCIDVDPNDAGHVFAGGRCGLYEFQDGKLVAYFNKDNSVLMGANDRGKQLGNNYVLVLGLKFDAKGNLWLLNSLADGVSLLEYTSDHQWINHHHTELTDDNSITVSGLSKMMTDSRGLLWFVNNNWQNAAVFCYDIDNDILLKYDQIINQDDTKYQIYSANCIAEDKEGNMWVGTDVGPFIIQKSEIGQNNVTFYQVKVPRNDGTDYADYLLNGVNINSIAVDGGNRKWFGTSGAGVFLMSADNIVQEENFTTDNSNLLYNDISSISINQLTGEVFFLSDNGLCSYQSNAAEPNEEMTKDHVWAYPNPVTPDYTGLVTITGLTYDADVKITTANGAIVAEGRSNGGMFNWDCCNKQGKRVASGIYMVITATSDGKKGTVAKIAVIN